MNKKKTINAGNSPSFNKIIESSITPFLVLIFLETVRIAWLGARENHSWVIGDWLINYRGGFVRRGLAGEIILSISSLSELDPAVLTAVLQSLCYLVFFLAALLMLKKQTSLQPYLLLIISPFIFTFQLHDSAGGFRKEIMYFALLAFFVWSTQIRKRKLRQTVMVSLLLCYPLLILSHEMLAVFLPYLIIVYFSRAGVSKRTILTAGLLALPSLLVFLIVLANPGTAGQVHAICASLGDYAPSGCTEDGSIASLAWTSAFAAQKVKYAIAHLSYIPLYVFVIFMSILALNPIGGRVKSNVMAGISLPLFLVSIAGTLLLFYIAGDWGRFIYIHLVSIFLVSLHSKEGEKSTEKSAGENISLTQWLLGGSGRRNSFEYMVVLLFGCCYALLWHIPSAGGNPFISEIFLRIIGHHL